MTEKNVLDIMGFSNAMADAVERASRITALVDARKRLPVSGILLGADLLLSVDHGIEKEEEIQVVVGSSRALGKVIGRDSGLDLAVIRLDQALPFERHEAGVDGRVGQPIFAVGKPDPDGVQASFGTVTAVGESLRTMRGSLLPRYYSTSATPYPGFSGGPLVDLAGRVIGINTSGVIGGVSLAIPFDFASQMAETLVQHGKIRRGYLGVRSQPVQLSEPTQSLVGRKQKIGLLVVGLEDNGPALNGGVLVGDIMLGINQNVIDNQDSLMQALSGDVVGKEVDLHLIRGGQPQTLKIKIGERS